MKLGLLLLFLLVTTGFSEGFDYLKFLKENHHQHSKNKDKEVVVSRESLATTELAKKGEFENVEFLDPHYLLLNYDEYRLEKPFVIDLKSGSTLSKVFLHQKRYRESKAHLAQTAFNSNYPQNLKVKSYQLESIFVVNTKAETRQKEALYLLKKNLIPVSKEQLQWIKKSKDFDDFQKVLILTTQYKKLLLSNKLEATSHPMLKTFKFKEKYIILKYSYLYGDGKRYSMHLPLTLKRNESTVVNGFDDEPNYREFNVGLPLYLLNMIGENMKKK